MTAFNNEISSADKIGLHLSEIGRLQNNAGSLIQFMALIVGIAFFYFNNVVYAAKESRLAYALFLAANAAAIGFTCFFYLRCLTLSVGWSAQFEHPRTRFHILSTLSEEQIETTLIKIVRSFRRGTYAFALSFAGAFIAIILVALMELNMLPK